MEDKRFVIRYHSQKKKKMNDLIIGGWGFIYRVKI